MKYHPLSIPPIHLSIPYLTLHPHTLGLALAPHVGIPKNPVNLETLATSPHLPVSLVSTKVHAPNPGPLSEEANLWALGNQPLGYQAPGIYLIFDFGNEGFSVNPSCESFVRILRANPSCESFV